MIFRTQRVARSTCSAAIRGSSHVRAARVSATARPFQYSSTSVTDAAPNGTACSTTSAGRRVSKTAPTSACCLIVGTRRRDQSCHRADWRQKNPRMNDRGECCLSVRSGKHQLRNAGNADGPVTFRQGDRSRHSAKSRRLAKRNAEPCTVNANKNSAAPIQVTTLWAEFGPFILLPFVLGVFLLRKGMRE